MVLLILLSFLAHPTYADEETSTTPAVESTTEESSAVENSSEGSTVENPPPATSEESNSDDEEHTQISQSTQVKADYFNEYILHAVKYLNKNYGLLGYRLDATFTHKLKYGPNGSILPTKGGATMCVAAVMETILTAFDIYHKVTGDNTVWEFLPIDSWRTFHPDSIKAYIWVDEEQLKSFGTGDALVHFGMGEHVPYEKLTPGSFANMNFADGFGHAVIFMNWIDVRGNEVKVYDEKKVVGMRFFSSQGEEEKGKGGLGYGAAIFGDRTCLPNNFKIPVYCGMMRSDKSKWLNTGRMYLPKDWKHPAKAKSAEAKPSEPKPAETAGGV